MVQLGGPMGLSLAGFLRKRMPGVARMLRPLAGAYANAMGHRQMGLRYDDLIIEERDDVQKALTRLTPRESYDRIYRHRVAFQQSILHRPLPKEQWIKKEDDVRYLTPIIKQVHLEDRERALWDSISVSKQEKPKEVQILVDGKGHKMF